MNLLIDDVARVLATPMSRRKAFARIAGILGGVLLASVPAQAIGPCGICTVNGDCTGVAANNCVSCPGGGSICCRPGYACCGTSHCCPNAACCNSQTGTCFSSTSCQVQIC
jgi:hypothetical protein